MGRLVEAPDVEIDAPDECHRPARRLDEGRLLMMDPGLAGEFIDDRLAAAAVDLGVDESRHPQAVSHQRAGFRLELVAPRQPPHIDAALDALSDQAADLLGVHRHQATGELAVGGADLEEPIAPGEIARPGGGDPDREAIVAGDIVDGHRPGRAGRGIHPLHRAGARVDDRDRRWRAGHEA
ncbi:MAG: hypothetical protein IPL61_22845 [Myxococcales bacterium]|nr:hypothetical protein [Myxococcales bacterium]